MNVTTGITAAVVTLVCWTIGTLAFAKAAARYAPVSINRVRLLYATVVLALLASILIGVAPWKLFTTPSLEHWLWLGLSGIIGLSIGDYFAFCAYQQVVGSTASLFTTFAPGAALLGGWLVLGEGISGIGLTGMGISVAGITLFIYLNNKPGTDKPAHAFKGYVYATLGAVCQGLGLVCAKKGLVLETILGPIHPVHATWMRMLVATAAVYGIGVFRLSLWQELKDVSLTARIIKPVALGTVFGPVLGVSASLLAATHIPVGVAQTVFSVLPITVMLAAALVYKEKLVWHSLLAALVGVLGVLILVWQDDVARWVG